MTPEHPERRPHGRGATLSPGATASDINAAIQACPEGQVVMLSAGTYDIADDGIVMKSGVTVRVAGADKTLLVFSGVQCDSR